MKSMKYFFASLLILAISVQVSMGQSFVLSLQYNPMSFTNANRTVLTNTGNNGFSQGSVHRYNNVVTIDGITVYAKLTVLEVNNAFITLFDDDATTSSRFQPRIGSNNRNGGYIVYKMEFFDAADNAPVFLYDYYMTGVDVDGESKNNREYIEIDGFASYQVDKSTQLDISTNKTTGRTRFLGRDRSLAGITFENTAAFITNFSTPNNVITFAMGQTGSNGERQYSAQFGSKGGNFSNPQTVNNPLPVAIDDVGIPVEEATGGITVDNVLSNDLYNGSPVKPTDVVIALISGAAHPGVALNTSTGRVTVAAGTPAGNYELTYQICMKVSPSDCDLANVFVEVIAPQNIVNYYPASGFGTLAFEDMWPWEGDYDFNDVVVDYRFEIHTNSQNYIKSVTGTFVLKAFGASYRNGFGFQFSGKIDPALLTVSGSQLFENYIKLSNNGTENGQSKPTIIVFDNTFGLMRHPGVGIGVNTDPAAPYVDPATVVIEINFPANTYKYNDLDIAGFNPFVIIDGVRGREVHLPDYEPTDLMDRSLLTTGDDDSNPSIGRYYKNLRNLPWGISLYESFDYPIEKAEITDAHLKFDDWAVSSGTLYPDWFKNLAGYRNNELIYKK